MPSSHRSPPASSRAACYSLLIFQWGKTSWGSLLSLFCCSCAGFCHAQKSAVPPQRFSKSPNKSRSICSPSRPPPCIAEGKIRNNRWGDTITPLHLLNLHPATISCCLTRTFFSFPMICRSESGLLPKPAISTSHFSFLADLRVFLFTGSVSLFFIKQVILHHSSL